MPSKRTVCKDRERGNSIMITGDFEKILFTEEEINKCVTNIAEEIDRIYNGEPIYIICILKGSIMFTVDLMKRIKSPVFIDFMAASSYGSGTSSMGKLTLTKDLTVDIAGKNVLIVEDIIDSGFTLSKIKEMLESRGAKTVRIATLLSKPSRRVTDVPVDFMGFEIPDEFVVGYGLDYDEKYRNLPYIAILARHVYEK